MSCRRSVQRARFGYNGTMVNVFLPIVASDINSLSLNFRSIKKSLGVPTGLPFVFFYDTNGGGSNCATFAIRDITCYNRGHERFM